MKIWLNGNFIEEEQLQTLPVDSSALRFGQGFFTTTAIHDRVPLWVDEHHRRLNQSLLFLNPAFRLDDNVKEAMRQWPLVNQVSHGLLRVLAWQSRGQIQVMIEGGPLDFSGPESIRLAISSLPRHSGNPLLRYKALGNWNYFLAEQESCLHQCHDVIFLNQNGALCETSRSNLFWVYDNQLFTPSAAAGLLTGIVREKVMDLADAEGIDVYTGFFPASELSQAQEIFITNSVRGIVPVHQVSSVSDHLTPGPLARRLQQLYRYIREAYVAAQR